MMQFKFVEQKSTHLYLRHLFWALLTDFGDKRLVGSARGQVNKQN